MSCIMSVSAQVESIWFGTHSPPKSASPPAPRPSPGIKSPRPPHQAAATSSVSLRSRETPCQPARPPPRCQKVACKSAILSKRRGYHTMLLRVSKSFRLPVENVQSLALLPNPGPRPFHQARSPSSSSPWQPPRPPSL